MKRETQLIVGVPTIDLIREWVDGHQGRIITASEIKQQLGPLGLTRGQWNYAREVLVSARVLQKTIVRGAYTRNGCEERQSPIVETDLIAEFISEAALSFYEDSGRYHGKMRAERMG